MVTRTFAIFKTTDELQVQGPIHPRSLCISLGRLCPTKRLPVPRETTTTNNTLYLQCPKRKKGEKILDNLGRKLPPHRIGDKPEEIPRKVYEEYKKISEKNRLKKEKQKEGKKKKVLYNFDPL